MLDFEGGGYPKPVLGKIPPLEAPDSVSPAPTQGITSDFMTVHCMELNLSSFLALEIKTRECFQSAGAQDPPVEEVRCRGAE